MGPDQSPAGRPRLLMVGPVPDQYGGVSVSAGHLLRGPLKDAWHIHYVATHRPEPGYREWRALQGFRKVDELLRRRVVDIAHLHVSADGSFWRKFLLSKRIRAAGVPVIVQLRGSRFFEFAVESRMRRRAVRRFLDHATAVVVLGEPARASVAGWTSNPEIHVVPNGTPPRPPAAPPRPPPFRVLSLGRLDAAKGAYDLVEAVPRVVAQVGEVDFMLAGEGDADTIRSRAAALGVPARVVCPGWLSPEDRDSALRGAHALVHASHREQLPNAVLEGMSAGLPIVATDVGCVRDAIEDDVTGLLVPPSQPERLAGAVLRLLQDRDLAERLGRQARARHAERFTPEAAAAGLDRVYRRALEIGVRG